MASCTSRQPCPNDKLVKNLCAMACGDGCETPCAAAAEGLRCDACGQLGRAGSACRKVGSAACLVWWSHCTIAVEATCP
jgi:hypothetical protein